jgi:DNA polymerase III gamma/tau subunit
MTISSTTVKNSYSGDGSTTTFNYTFKIFANSDLQVIIRSSTGTETVKTITTHYTVTGAGSASGGTVVFTAGNIPTATETVVLRRAVPQTQSIDYIANDPFPAESHEEGLDRAMMTLQQVQEEVTRSLKLSRTNTMTSTEFTVGASDRANKILAFDGSGELSVTQELGTYQGNWSASTTYYARDIVKDSSNNNIYICNTNHISSGTTPISSNTDSVKWDLLVDAASATSSATAAASSASAAATSASNAASSASAASTSASNAATSETNAGTSETNAATSASSASTSATNASNSATSASTSASNASTSATNASNSATAAASSATTATTQATNASNSASAASTSATNASNSATAASTSASNAATSESNAASSASTASSAATAAQTAQAAAEAAADNFDDTYLGAKSSDPSVDNDGDPLTTGDLYFNTSTNELKVYNGSAWQTAAVDASSFSTKGFATAMAIAL